MFVLNSTEAKGTMRIIYRAIVDSFNAMPYARIAALVGDWKFLQESLELRRYYATRLVCHRCLASRNDMYRIDSSAPWRTTVHAHAPYDEANPSPLTNLKHFTLVGCLVLAGAI